MSRFADSPGDFSPTSGPIAGDMPDDLDLGYSPAFLAATDFIKDGTQLLGKLHKTWVFLESSHDDM